VWSTALTDPRRLSKCAPVWHASAHLREMDYALEYVETATIFPPRRSARRAAGRPVPTRPTLRHLLVAIEPMLHLGSLVRAALLAL
jgi:hypothetical protein